MCGISGIFGPGWKREQLEAMVKVQHHRGPDAQGIYISPDQWAGLGHNRLSILDLSDAGRQPMSDSTGRYQIVFNGEIYNYLEIRKELEKEYSFRSKTDTEVLLAAYIRWGPVCLDKFIGMFSFLIWDEKEKTLFGARDRFGVKPFYYHHTLKQLTIASEIKTIHAAGIAKEQDPAAWATYLTYGLYGHSERTFWKGIQSLPAGHWLEWKAGNFKIHRWYDLAEHSGLEFDQRPVDKVQEEYLSLLKESIQLRFRADVSVGINLSGGLDSSILLGLVQEVQGKDNDVKAFTFTCGDPHYDELPWVRQMLERTKHPSIVCELNPVEVPRLASDVQHFQDEPYGGIPTLAYAKIFERARAEGVLVLLDGQGMDEQWAGYDYYRTALEGKEAGIVQGTKSSPVRPDCLIPEFRALAESFEAPKPFSDVLRNLQYRDICFTKIPRALRFNDRISMRSSTELREPFLDHRLVELALRQPVERKIKNSSQKWMLRKIAAQLLPEGVVEAPKRALQTPQREWLRGPLKEWTEQQISLLENNPWFDKKILRQEWKHFSADDYENSFFIWQWLSISSNTGTKHSSQA